jgi:O-antigen ligase
MFCFNLNATSSLIKGRLFSKTKAVNLFLQGKTYRYESIKTSLKPDVSLDMLTEESPESAALGNIAWRLNIWKQSLKFYSDSPLVGKGFGVYPVYDIWGTHQYPKGIYLNSKMVPMHNHLITIVFKMGVLGLGLFLFINIYVFMYALSYLNKCKLRLINNFLVALLGSFVFWHTFALFFDVIDSPPTSIFLWIIMGLIFAAIEIDKSSSVCEIKNHDG